jgi:hypothetical protein
MNSRRLFASVLTACLMAAGVLGSTPAAAADVERPRYVKPGKYAKSNVVVTKRYYRDNRGVRIHLPVGPSSIYCEYTYRYSLGHYPTHIGGYIYYPRNFYRTC